MNRMTNRLIGFAAAAAIYAASLPMVSMSHAVAAEWNPKKITLVLPHSLGGGQDRLTRALIKVWAKHLGTKLEVLNKRGASGRIGFDYFQTQPKDGTVILTSNIATTGTMYAQQKPDWSWEETIHILGVFGVDPAAVFVLKDSPFQSMKDVIAAGKKKRTVLALSSWSSAENITLHQMMDQTGAKYQIIPIGGGSDLVTAVLGGHVPIGLGKVSNISKGGDRVRVLAVTLEKNPVEGMTNNAPTLDKALGTKTIPVASYRSIIVPASLKKEYPDRYKKLKQTFEATKDDPEYIKLAKKVGISRQLILDKDHDELQALVKSYWAAYDKHGAFFKQKQKMIKVKSKLVDVKKKGKRVVFIDSNGKKTKIKVHRRRTKVYIGGKRQKGKKGLAMLKKGMDCEIGYIGVPVLARQLKCK
ncbi:MAG: tripartite tricarboxylate transporter substrate-binding protein [Candidatus Methylomirabilales bacterium]